MVFLCFIIHNVSSVIEFNQQWYSDLLQSSSSCISIKYQQSSFYATWYSGTILSSFPRWLQTIFISQCKWWRFSDDKSIHIYKCNVINILYFTIDYRHIVTFVRIKGLKYEIVLEVRTRKLRFYILSHKIVIIVSRKF